MEEREMKIDLGEVLFTIRKKLGVIVLFSIISGLAFFLLSTLVLKPKYESFVDIYVTNTASSSQSSNDSVNYNDINASQKLVSTYSMILQTDEVLELLRKETNLTMTTPEILDVLSFTQRNNTEILRIVATTNDPYLSAKICNGYAAIAQTVTSEVIQGGSAKILSKAKANGEPSSPNVRVLTVAGFFLGFCISAAAFVLVTMFSNKIKGEDEVAERCNVAVIGSVPDFFSLKELKIPHSVKAKNKKLVAAGSATNEKLITDYTKLTKDSPFVVTESYNMIRTNLMFSLSTASSRVIIISSSLPNECKSTTSVNIALSFAHTGARVLLIDADLRNPTLHKIFKKSNKKGLSRVVAGFDKLGSSIVTDPGSGLDVLFAGPNPPNPSELLGSANTEKMLEVLQKHYDYIFIDTPPINVVADAVILSRYAGGIVLVVRENKSRYNDLNKAMAKVSNANCNLLGVVITDSERLTSGYGSYGYGYGYGSSK